jgi:hypothetical protein
MRLHFFLGACVLTCVLLLSLGAPLPSVAAGITSAGFLTWRKYRRERRRTKSNPQD